MAGAARIVPLHLVSLRATHWHTEGCCAGEGAAFRSWVAPNVQAGVCGGCQRSTCSSERLQGTNHTVGFAHEVFLGEGFAGAPLEVEGK